MPFQNELMRCGIFCRKIARFYEIFRNDGLFVAAVQIPASHLSSFIQIQRLYSFIMSITAYRPP